jgi:integral membrane sensor domain MASE1
VVFCAARPDTVAFISGGIVQHIIMAVVVAVGYVALACVSSDVAYSKADAWTVWLASGLVLGLLLARPRAQWPAILAGGFAGAAAFDLWLGGGIGEALGYGVIEAVAAATGAFVASRVTALPIRLDSPRSVVAVVLGGALPLALCGAAIATAWHVAGSGGQAVSTFRVWALSNFIGSLLVAPMIISWSQFKARRSGGLPMINFIGGAIACVLFLGSLWLLFDAREGTRFTGSVGQSLTYIPIVFMALTALLWGTRGATLAAFLGALLAILNTAQGEGPFAGVEGFLGEAELEVQGYAVAIAMTGLLIAVLDVAQRTAMRAARDWQTRFEATIGAHRLLAYEWDPASGRIVVTGDSAQLVGVPPAALASLADWAALIAPADRDRVMAHFDERVRLDGTVDALDYLVKGPGGQVYAATDEARAIRDHDGVLHRIVAIVRVAATGAAPAPKEALA